jgi:predicted HicB family RNase H-like nuclease
LNDTLAFHGKSVDELKSAFQNCIEDYIDLCKEIGKQPEKEFRGVFNVRISPESHRQAAIEAAKDGVTMNQFVADSIEERLARRRAAMI